MTYIDEESPPSVSLTIRAFISSRIKGFNIDFDAFGSNIFSRESKIHSNHRWPSIFTSLRYADIITLMCFNSLRTFPSFINLLFLYLALTCCEIIYRFSNTLILNYLSQLNLVKLYSSLWELTWINHFNYKLQHKPRKL